MTFSIIVPVYNRPDEVDELLQSLCEQTIKDFEVIIVEDGSTKPCEDVCRKYEGQLDLKYFMKPNSGPGQSRNYGAERAQGEYLIILDSDVVVPEKYIESVERRVENPAGNGERRVENGEFATAVVNSAKQTVPETGAVASSQFSTLNSQLTCFGGPDRSHPSFTPIQKAISYSMTSFFTTGGIRGGSSPFKGSRRGALDKFYPRSFNMGIRRDVYLQLGGFSKMRFGEDIDFSYRIVEAGYQPRLFPEAWVWHKRRTDFRKFFRQVFNSGIARINLEKRHPGTMKLVHMLPAVFTVGVIVLLLLLCLGIALYAEGEWLDAHGLRPTDNMHQGVGFMFCVLALFPLLFYSLVIFIDSSIQNRSVYVGLLSIPAAFTQLMGYGLGFLKAWWKRCVLKQDEFTAYEKVFYK